MLPFRYTQAVMTGESKFSIYRIASLKLTNHFFFLNLGFAGLIASW